MSGTGPHSSSSIGLSPTHYPDLKEESTSETPDEIDTSLGPLERLQRKWGIGDRKTRDGQPAKRRGPKPDSKPAQTRRQELNRQAQRTHRERKENYMRELETSIDHLRRLYQRDVIQVKQENEKLREILQAHGIQYDLGSPSSSQPYTSPGSLSLGASPPNYGGPNSQSTNFNSMSPPNQPSMQMLHASSSFPAQQSASKSLQGPASNLHGLDYDDIGLGFVADLEENCMSHQQYMVNKSLDDEDWCSGHALMATAPPIDHVREHGMDKQYPHQLPDLPKPDLAKLLNLCPALPGLNGEITPIMAWAFILAHPSCPELTEDDIDMIKQDLKGRVTCYGSFGAVMEDFEVKDALDKILGTKKKTKSEMEWEASYTG